jgi:hypothetical protein
VAFDPGVIVREGASRASSTRDCCAIRRIVAKRALLVQQDRGIDSVADCKGGKTLSGFAGEIIFVIYSLEMEAWSWTLVTVVTGADERSRSWGGDCAEELLPQRGA